MKPLNFSILINFLFILCCSSCNMKSKDGNVVFYSWKHDDDDSIKDSNIKTESDNNIENTINNSTLEKSTMSESLSDVYERVRKSVMLVIADEGKSIAQGSAFFINEYGVCVSNQHVFSGASLAVIKTFDGEVYNVTGILEENKDDDYIIFTTNAPTNKYAFLSKATSNSRVGDKCFAIGNPMGLEQTLTDGIISSYREDEKFIQSNTLITHGSSGGPLFNQQGQVIGITTSGVEDKYYFSLNIHKVPIEKYLQYNPK